MEVTSYLLGKKAGGGGSEPTGTINITSNGTKNVKSYATANVNVQPNLQNKSVTVNTNGSTSVSADNNYDGLDTVSITTNVQPNLETKSVTITENGTTTVSPTSGKDGLSSVSITTNVSGGGGTVDTITKLNEKANEYIDYVLNIPNSYSSSTDEQITLYTPNESYKSYVILKRSNNTYRVLWLRNYSGISLTSNDEYYCTTKAFYPSVIQTTGFNLVDFENEISITNNFMPDAYMTNAFNTLETCLQAIKSNDTTYSKMSSYQTLFKGQENIIYSNTFVYDGTEEKFFDLQKISSNETIQVIQ